MTTLDGVRLTTVADYHKMAEAGVFAPDERIELIEGYIRTMSPIGKRHSIVVKRLTRSLMKHFGEQYDISVQDPIILSDLSEPQPDLAVVTRFEDAELPTATDSFLVIEVSDTTLKDDRTVKVPLYAAAGIPEVWIVDVNSNTIVQLHTLQEGKYSYQRTWQKGEVIPTTLGVAITTADILLKG